jgi:hypothetical protein
LRRLPFFSLGAVPFFGLMKGWWLLSFFFLFTDAGSRPCLEAFSTGFSCFVRIAAGGYYVHQWTTRIRDSDTDGEYRCGDGHNNDEIGDGDTVTIATTPCRPHIAMAIPTLVFLTISAIPTVASINNTNNKGYKWPGLVVCSALSQGNCSYRYRTWSPLSR